MLYRAARLAGLATAVIALTLALASGASLASARQPPGFYFSAPWRAVEVVNMSRQAWFTDVTATGRDSAWAVGDHTGATGTTTTGGFAVRWSGHRWRLMTLPVSPFVPVSVSSRGSSGVWIFGYRPVAGVDADKYPAYALVFKNGHWHIRVLPSGPKISWEVLWDLQSAVVTDQNVWVVGTAQNPDATHVRSVLWHWNGSAWTSHPLPVGGADSLSAAPGAVWVTTLAANGRTTAYQWTGVSWRRWRLPYVTLGTVAVDAPHNLWIGGAAGQDTTTYLLHWNGRRWTRGETPLSADLGTSFADGHGGVWFSQWAHWTGGKWYEPSAWPTWRGCSGTGTGELAAVPGTTAVWFVGVCLSGHDDFSRPIIGLTGRL